jgi:hypothetical protein
MGSLYPPDRALYYIYNTFTKIQRLAGLLTSSINAAGIATLGWKCPKRGRINMSRRVVFVRDTPKVFWVATVAVTILITIAFALALVVAGRM